MFIHRHILAILLVTFCALAGSTELGDAVRAYREGSYAQAFKGFEALAEKGEPLAQTFLGSMYNAGQGVEKNEDLAMSWFRKAAEQGEPSAQRNLGVYYWDHAENKNDLKDAEK